MKTPQNVFYAHGFGKAAPWVDLANSDEWDGFGKRTDHLGDPEWVAGGVGPCEEGWELGTGGDRRFVNANISGTGRAARANLCQCGLPMDFSRSHEGRHEALVQ